MRWTTAVTVGVFALGAACAAGQIVLDEPAAGGRGTKKEAVDRARVRLGEKLKVSEAAITLESATEATWGNSSLGCPEKGRMYAQVVTEGWKVLLKVGTKTHEVHVGGNRVVFCPDPCEVKPDEPSR